MVRVQSYATRGFMTDMIKIDTEELKETSSLRDQMADLFGQLGQLSISEKLLEDELTSVRSQKDAAIVKYRDLAKQEDDLVMKLTKKYGVGSLDLETGNFTPEK